MSFLCSSPSHTRADGWLQFHFVSLDKNDLALFTFQIFDLDAGGSLEFEELDFLVSVLWGKHESDAKIKMVSACVRRPYTKGA